MTLMISLRLLWGVLRARMPFSVFFRQLRWPPRFQVRFYHVNMSARGLSWQMVPCPFALMVVVTLENDLKC